MIQKRREERYKQYERQKRQWFYTRIGLAAVAVMVVGAIAFVIFNIVQDRIDEQALDDVQEFSYGTDHVAEPPDYAEAPPAGGPHNAAWQNCGYYEAPIEEWYAVHSLEHGAVWITYRPDLPQEQIDELRDLTESNNYLVVSPYPDQATPIVMTAWNRQLPLDSTDERAFDAFIRQYTRSSHVPEPQGICIGGISTTAPA
ncbi:MAG TPA: DUF3105 domain-containing protein [Methylomirabilota bacterium]|nr:DUF3105 domain-containing protein [Methylomirabilota bacterium]